MSERERWDRLRRTLLNAVAELRDAGPNGHVMLEFKVVERDLLTPEPVA